MAHLRELFGRDLTPAVIGKVIEVRKQSYGETSHLAGRLAGYASHGEGRSNWLYLEPGHPTVSPVNMRWSPESPPGEDQARVFVWEP